MTKRNENKKNTKITAAILTAALVAIASFSPVMASSAEVQTTAVETSYEGEMNSAIRQSKQSFEENDTVETLEAAAVEFENVIG